jgi:hypothetical protein
MKKECRKLLHACALVLLLTSLSLAQQPAASISDLREQIRKLKATASDSAETPEGKALADTSLNQRRAQLAALLERKIDALVKYRSAAKDTLTAEKNQAVADTLRGLENELRELTGKMPVGEPVAAVAPASSPTMTAEGSSAPARRTPDAVGAASPESNVGAAAPPAPQTVTPVSPATCNGATDSYPDAPSLLRDAAEKVADDIIAGDETPVEVVANIFPTMFFYTVAHAVSPTATSDPAVIEKLEAYQYLGETARTDKQVGASAKSAGTTSAIEKPSFARFLGLAVENGAITQEVSKTSLTLSTSPYILYTFGNGGDTAENYERAGFLNRVGLFATFNLTDQNDPLSSATRSQLTEWSIKTRVFGDRSTRSKAFQDFWNAPGGPRDAILTRLEVLSRGAVLTLPGGRRPTGSDRLANVNQDVNNVVAALMSSAAYTGADNAGKKRLLTNAILCVFKNEVFDNIKSDPTLIGAETRQEINSQLVPRLAAALDNLRDMRKLLEGKIDDFQKGALGTVSYVNHRQSEGSDYSEGKFLFEMDSKALRPMKKLVANFGVSFYHNPDRTKNQQTARDVTAALSFEGSVKSPMLAGTADLSKITYAFTGNYQRTFENRGVAGRKADIGSFQFKVDFPLFAGVSLPFSVTYSNATEEERKKHVRANFGLHFDADKLFAVTRLMH